MSDQPFSATEGEEGVGAAALAAGAAVCAAGSGAAFVADSASGASVAA